MIQEFWNTILYTPLLNALIGLYNTIGRENLGLAVVWLTIGIRLLLLPLSFIEERNKERYTDVARKWHSLIKDIPNDHVLQRGLLREYLKEKQVSPWAKIFTLGFQLLVLVLLYQVFIGGFQAPETFPLYAFIQRPEFIVTSFFGFFDIAAHNAFVAGIVAFFLLVTIILEQREYKNLLTRSHIYYRMFFPLFTFVALLLLPSVKSLFILTSMLFTQVLHGVRLLVQQWQGERKKIAVAGAPQPILTASGDPWQALRK